jgi:ATP-dependent DNA helicase RecQ
LEIRYFLRLARLKPAGDVSVIGEADWNEAKRALTGTFTRSSKLELCLNLIGDFTAANPGPKYQSDLDVFIRESKIEDFTRESGNAVLVSTMHKAKGREFDNVFMMPTRRKALSDEEKRLWYVAMTRAKKRLHIYLHGTDLDGIHVDKLRRQNLRGAYPPPAEMVLHLTHEDVNLGHFGTVQKSTARLMCGDSLAKGKDGWAGPDGKTVLKFSRRFTDRLPAIDAGGFVLRAVKVGFILYWKGQNIKQDIRIILPELYFSRK